MKLSKSQRIKTIENLSTRMEADEWTSIDLVLKEFDLPTSDNWSGGKKSYVMRMVAGASDDQLGEASMHFGIPINRVGGAMPAQPEPAYWSEGKVRVFISHLSAHREQVNNLKLALSWLGMSAFVAHSDIHPTLEWQMEIERALSTCELLVALIHPEFIASQWCDQEIGYALGRSVPVFTVRCGADPYGFVSRFQAFNGNGKNEKDIAQMLFEASIAHKKLQERMGGILIDLFVKSGSFSASKTRIAYVENISNWKPEFSLQIAAALRQNDQISGSWGVPEQVAKLLAAHR